LASVEGHSCSSLFAVTDKEISRSLEPKEDSSRFSSLALLGSKNAEVLISKSSSDCGHFSSLAHLAEKHLSEALEQQQPPVKSCYFSPQPKLANKYSSDVHGVSSDLNGFSSLIQLADRHNKAKELRASGNDNISSLTKLANSHLNSQIQAAGQALTLAEVASHYQLAQKEDSISSLVDLASQQLKIHEDPKSSDTRHVKKFQKAKHISCSLNEDVNLKKCVVFSPANESSMSTGKESVLPVAHKLDSLGTGLQTSKTKSERKGYGVFTFPGMVSELVTNCETSVDTGSHVVDVEHNSVDRTLSEEESEMDWEIDLTPALMSPGSRNSQSSKNGGPNVMDSELKYVEQGTHVDDDLQATPELRLEFDASLKILNQNLPNRKRRSQFGRILCMKWKQLSTPYIAPRRQSLSTISRFTFNTDSPDDIILKHQRRK
jgi:hypothetical protein